jgi:hypothetical protein
MKTTNSILTTVAVSAFLTLSSCTATVAVPVGRPASSPIVVVNDRDLPQVPGLTPRQVRTIKNIRMEERARVNELERRRDVIISDIRHLERSYGNHNSRKLGRLKSSLRQVENDIHHAHRRADKKVYSVLAHEQRRYFRW